MASVVVLTTSTLAVDPYVGVYKFYRFWWPIASLYRYHRAVNPHHQTAVSPHHQTAVASTGSINTIRLQANPAYGQLATSNTANINGSLRSDNGTGASYITVSNASGTDSLTYDYIPPDTSV